MSKYKQSKQLLQKHKRVTHNAYVSEVRNMKSKQLLKKFAATTSASIFKLKNNKVSAVIAGLVIVVGVVFTSTYFTEAASFTDNSQSTFNGGTYSNTQWDNANQWVELTPASTTGTYTSSIRDAGQSSTWNSLAWTAQKPNTKNLPDNAQTETAYPAANANMTGNVGLWHLNSNSALATDSSGAGNDLTKTNSTFTNSGRIGGAQQFAIAGGNLNKDINNYRASDEQGTIEAWIYPTTVTGNLYIFGSAEYTSANNYLTLRLRNSRLDFVTGQAAAANSIRGNTLLTAYTWYHVAVTSNGTAWKLFVNGVEDTGSPEFGTNNGSWFADIANRTNLTIGALRFANSNKMFPGTIDEVAVYNRELSSSEIADHYTRGALNLRFQVRSCDDVACSGETFVGPDGTAATYYSELDNSTLGTPSLALSNVPNNQFFQYRAFFDTTNTTYSPELKDVTVNYSAASNQAPATPSNSTPANGATGVASNPTLSGSAYSDPESDPQTNTQWQVDDDADFSSPVWTRTAGSAESSIAVNSSNGSFGNELASHTALADGVTYHWRVRYSDGQWSNYSTATSFTTVPGVNQAPATPTNSAPANATVGTSRNPVLIASAYSDPDSDAQTSIGWQVDDDADFSSPVWTRTASPLARQSTLVNSENGTFANELAGQSRLAANTTYHWRVRYSDGQWSNYSTSTSITTLTATSTIPATFDDNSFFNDEFLESDRLTSGWSNTSWSATNPADVAKLPNNFTMSRPITYPANTDWIGYTKVKTDWNSGFSTRLSFNGAFDTNNSLTIGIDQNWDTDQVEQGSISVYGKTSSGTVRKKKLVGGLDTSQYIELAVNFDRKYSVYNIFSRSGSTYTLLGRLDGSSMAFSGAGTMNISTTSAANSFAYIDYLTVSKPNIVAIGDSITMGAPGWYPGTLANSTWSGSYEAHVNIYDAIRNNFVVNKGISSQTSAQINSRIQQDVIDQGARLVILQSSDNDQAASISQTTRNANINSSINLLKANNVATVLISSIIPNVNHIHQPGSTDYFLSWTANYFNTATFPNADLLSDIAPPIADGMGVSKTSLAPDGIHPQTAGHTLIGNKIESDIEPFLSGVIITQSGGQTIVTEGGATDSYSLALKSQPTADVTISVTSQNTTSGVTVSPSSVTFTSANWQTPQFITVTAVNDSQVEGSHSATITHAATSTDDNYNALEIADVVVQINDNDPDGDSDGIDDTIEDAAPNNGDGNDDGTPDSEQAHVASFVNPVTGNYAVLAVDDECEITSVAINTENDNTTQDTNYQYPLGLMDFTIECEDDGYAANITQYYYGTTGDGFTLRKYNPNTDTYFTIEDSDIEHVTIDSQPVTTASYSITDGGELDMDEEENGTIVDPVGLAAAVSGNGGNNGGGSNGDSGTGSSSGGNLADTGQNLLPVMVFGILLLAGSSFYVHRRLILK